MKTLSLALAITLLGAQSTLTIPPRRHYNHSVKITTDYDRFKDATTIQQEPINLTEPGTLQVHTLQLSTIFRYKGQSFTMPSEIALLFVSRSPGWKFLDSRHLRVIAGEKRFDFGEATRVKSEVLGARDVLEMLLVMVPLPDYLAMVAAEKIEMQLGTLEFMVSGECLEAMTDLASRLRAEP